MEEEDTLACPKSLDHPSLPTKADQAKGEKKWTAPGNRGMVLKSPSIEFEETPAKRKWKRKWAAGNEERLVGALKRFKSLKLRVVFAIWEEDENRYQKYKTLAGTTLVFRKIPTIGLVWKIVKAVTDLAVEIVRGKEGEEEGEI